MSAKEIRKLMESVSSLVTEAPHKMDAFCTAYVEAALWSSTDNSNEQGGDPLDRNYSPEDIAPEAMDQMHADCASFQEKAWDDISDNVEGAGHDFWLTRNGHGAGFWDGDWPEEIGEKLTALSKEYGEVDLYIGDDGMIYSSGGMQEAREPMDDPDEWEDEDDMDLLDQNHAHDEEPPFDWQGEMETGVVIKDNTRGGYDVSAEGKYLGNFSEMDEARGVISQWMEQHQYWPNVFFVNDHGNVTQVDKDGNEIRSIV